MVEKTANKRSGTSWTWEYGAELREVNIPSMRQMAFDHISMPAMSAETERVFSDTKLFISDLRSRLGPEIIEALESIRK